MQCTFKLEKSEEENSETERSRISEESKKEARRKSQSYVRHTTVFSTLNNKTKTEETT